ncbi:helix-turn-helix transcriptional regulator [Mycobacterium sp. IS-1590]|uniref:helix-turn-helix domain-containing protein n=1 Tax=Mycobacterium sp. IS-1590 TaxID=1772286 RepID=UPI0018D273E1|nr:helix-turn-helix transcriptional regulator [Mycobacterium sp. IS-1590]
MDDKPVGVRETLGHNLRRIRNLRELTVRDLSARLKALGLSLSPSGVSEVENAVRKVGIDELLIIAMALNTSIIELVSPQNWTTKLQVAKGAEPIRTDRLRAWIKGEAPWSKAVDVDEFLEAATEYQRQEHAITARPDIAAITFLRALAMEDVECMGYIAEPEPVAAALRRQSAKVSSYMELLADEVAEHGADKRRSRNDDDGR